VRGPDRAKLRNDLRTTRRHHPLRKFLRSWRSQLEPDCPGTIRSVLRGERPVIRSDGQHVRDYFYVEDGAAAYLMLAENWPPIRLWRRSFQFLERKFRSRYWNWSRCCSMPWVPISPDSPERGEQRNPPSMLVGTESQGPIGLATDLHAGRGTFVELSRGIRTSSRQGWPRDTDSQLPLLQLHRSDPIPIARSDSARECPSRRKRIG